MSPVATDSRPDFVPITDLNDRDLNLSNGFSFDGSSIGGFDCSKAGAGRSNFSGRLKPRLTKTRRKQAGTSQYGKSTKCDPESVPINFLGSHPIDVSGSQPSCGSNSEADQGTSVGSSHVLSYCSGIGVTFDGKIGFGSNNEKVDAGSAEGLNESMRQFGKWDNVFCANKTYNISTSDLKNENTSFGFNTDGPVVSEVSKDKDFLSLNKGSSILNFLSVNGEFTFCANESDSQLKSDPDNGDCVLNDNQSGLASKKETYYFNSEWSSEVHMNCKVNNEAFAFSAHKDLSNNLASTNQYSCRNARKKFSSKGARKKAPDWGKLRVNTKQSENVGRSDFIYSCNRSDCSKADLELGANSDDVIPDADLGKNTESKYSVNSEFVHKIKEDLTESQRPGIDGVFVFGERSEKSLNSNKDTEPGGEVKDLNVGKVESCNASMKHIGNKSESKIESNLSSSWAFQPDPLFRISDEMKRLNIHDSQGVAKTTDFSNSAANNKYFFVFGSCHNVPCSSTEKATSTPSDQPGDSNSEGPRRENILKKTDGVNPRTDGHKGFSFDAAGDIADSRAQGAGWPPKNRSSESQVERGDSNEQINSSCSFVNTSGKENQPLNVNKNASDRSQPPHIKVGMNKTSFPFLFRAMEKGYSHESYPASETDNEEKVSSTSIPGGVCSPFTDFAASNLKFSFETTNLFSSINKNTNFTSSNRFVRGRRLKKMTGKLRQKTHVRQLSGQDCMYKDGSSEQNQGSPVCGSPMDFSPYQNCNKAQHAGDTNMATGVKDKDFFGAREESPVDETAKTCGEASSKDLKDHYARPHDEGRNSTCSTSLPDQDGLSAIRRQYKKKYKLRVAPNDSSLCQKSACSPSVKLSSQVPSRAPASSQQTEKKEEDAKQYHYRPVVFETCEHCRIRGNQAYEAGNLSKAEEFYSMGITSVSDASILEGSIKPLLLCYSNRAATRMSLGRMREAIRDCKKAEELDPSFLKVTLRAGNCYLVLGEVQDAIECYQKCLQSGTGVCLDRRIAIEAADGLQRALRVSEYIHKSVELLKEKNPDAATSALGIITDALSTSRYSERLLEMKGEALCTLQRHNEVIELCEQTLHNALKNFTTNELDDPNCESLQLKLWRWNLQSKSHFHLGRLEAALDLIEKQEKMISLSTKPGNMTQKSSSPLAATVRELLRLKGSGNEAFRSGRYAEAVEYYTVAIPKGIESRSFTAVCFCNRAAAYQALGQIVDAIADCSLAIALDENYAKAISRRATLHEMIRDYKQAVDDLQKLISLLERKSQTTTQQSSPETGSGGGNGKELRRVRRHISSIEQKAKREIPLDFYLILGVKAADTESEIKKAYRKAALKHHPDKAGQFLTRSDSGDDGRLWKEVSESIHKDADRLFKIIGEAYGVLSDPSKRSKYDDAEEIRNAYTECNRNSDFERPSTSYNSPYEKSNWSGRHAGSPYEKSYYRRQWQEAYRSHSNSYSTRW